MAAAALDPVTHAARVLRPLWWLTVLAVLLWSAQAAAHPMPESRVWMDTRADGLTLTLQLPLNRLEFGFGQPLADDPAQVLERHAEALSRYLLAHVGVHSGALAWRAQQPALRVVGSDASAELEATMTVLAPAGADPRRFELSYDAITHEVRTHRVMVLLRNDWAAGHVGEPPRPLGELHTGLTRLPVALDAARATAAVTRLFQLGMTHIAEGTDHLLFLLTLLLVAPVAARQRRWAEARAPRAALGRILAVVTCFTVGHTVTLLLGSAGWVTLPTAWVEAAVAASIVVAAVHAWRPLLDRGELLMAGGFGLLHGLAFSSGLATGGLTVGQHALALLAFNLGIEAMQLVVVACAMPPLLVLASSAPAIYARLRTGVALVGGFVALVWTAERLLPSLPMAMDTGLTVTPVAAQLACALLWAMAAGCWLARARTRTRPAISPSAPD